MYICGVFLGRTNRTKSFDLYQVALTGASGHLGIIIHHMLLIDGIKHKVFLKAPVDYIHTEEVINGDLENESSRKELVKDCHTIIHCAGKVWPKKGKNPSVIRINCEMTKCLFMDAVEAGVKHFVYISSIHSMKTPHHDAVFDETAQLADSPYWPYDFSKAEAERFLTQRDEMKVTILNPTAIIGPGDHYYRAMNQLFHRIHNNRLPAITAGGFSVVDVRDVARAVINASSLGIEGKFILGGNYYTMVDLAKMYGEINNHQITSRVLGPRLMRFLAALSVPVDRLAASPLAFNTYAVEALLEGHSGISSDAARNKLGFSPRPIQDSLRDLNAWFVHQNLNL